MIGFLTPRVSHGGLGGGSLESQVFWFIVIAWIEMECLHSQLICPDLKLTNVFVVSDDVLCSGVCFEMSDSGTSREGGMTRASNMTQSVAMTNNIGTPLHTTPEIVSGVGHCSMKSYVCHCGILIVSLENQKHPDCETQNIESRCLLCDKAS